MTNTNYRAELIAREKSYLAARSAAWDAAKVSLGLTDARAVYDRTLDAESAAGLALEGMFIPQHGEKLAAWEQARTARRGAFHAMHRAEAAVESAMAAWDRAHRNGASVSA